MYTKSRNSAPAAEGQETKPGNGRGRRYTLLRAAQGALWRKGIDHADQHRTVWCSRSSKSHMDEAAVRLWRDAAADRPGGPRAGLWGLNVCGNVWTCPVCSAKVAEHRREEIQRALVAWVELGSWGPAPADGRPPASTHTAHLVTLTTPHTEGDDLGELQRRQDKALHSFNNARSIKAVRAAYGYAGGIKAAEITWGVNGWHPHTHTLWFSLRGLDDDRAAVRTMKRAWLRACLKQKLITTDGTLRPFRNFWRHSVDVRGGERAAEYIAKYGRDEGYGLSGELTRFHAKVGLRRTAWASSHHFTPFQLLEWSAGGDTAARLLFAEFARVYSGKRALVWSRGLKAKLGIVDRDDADIAADDTPKPAQVQVATLNTDQFREVLARNAIADLIEFVAVHCCNPDTDQACVEAWLFDLIADSPPTHSGTFRQKRWKLPGYNVVSAHA